MAGKGSRSGGSSKGSRSSRGSSLGRSSSNRSSRSSSSRPSPSRPSPSRHNSSRHRGPGLGGFLAGLFVGKAISSNESTTTYHDNSQPQYAQPAQPAAPPQPQIVECTHCSTRRPAAESYCPGCGSPDSVNVTPEVAPPAPSMSSTTSSHSTSSSNRRTMVVVIVIVVAAVLLIGMIANFLGWGTYGVGQNVRTKWFDFQVMSTQTVRSYDEGAANYVAPSGFVAVLVDLEVSNTTNEVLPMYDNDFLLVSKRSFGSTTKYRPLTDIQLPTYFDTPSIPTFVFDHNDGSDKYYELAVGRTIDGRLVFVIPDDFDSLTLEYTEYDEYGTRGETYVVKL